MLDGLLNHLPNASTAPAIGAAEALAYAERVLGLLAFRELVPLPAASVDAYLALVSTWALRGCPAGEFSLKLPELVGLVAADSENTVRDAVDRLVAAGLLTRRDSTGKGNPTGYTLGPPPIELKVRYQNLIPTGEVRYQLSILKAPAGSTNRYQLLIPTSANSHQVLIPKLDSGTVEVQKPIPIIEKLDGVAANAEAVSESGAAATVANSRNFGHSSIITDKVNLNTTTPNSTTTSPEKSAKPARRKKGDEEFAECLEEFLVFWNAYGKKGDRYLTLSKFSRLSKADRVALLAATPAYVAANSGDRYEFRAYAENFIERRRFEAVNTRLAELALTNPERLTQLNPLAPNVTTNKSRRTSEHLRAPEHADDYGELGAD